MRKQIQLIINLKRKCFKKVSENIFFPALFVMKLQSCEFLTEKTQNITKTPSKPKTKSKPIKQNFKKSNYLIEHLLKPVMNSRHLTHKPTQITQDWRNINYIVHFWRVMLIYTEICKVLLLDWLWAGHYWVHICSKNQGNSFKKPHHYY